MRERREIATGADRSFFGNDRMHAAIEHFAKHLDDFEADSAEAERENIGAQQHHGAHFRLGKRLADAAGVTAHKIELKIAQLFVRNAHVGEFAETGVYSVNDRVALDDFVDDFARSIESGGGAEI